MVPIATAEETAKSVDIIAHRRLDLRRQPKVAEVAAEIVRPVEPTGAYERHADANVSAMRVRMPKANPVHEGPVGFWWRGFVRSNDIARSELFIEWRKRLVFMEPVIRCGWIEEFIVGF
jgi:hypothetical protein